MKALLGPLHGCCRAAGKERGAGFREGSEAVENDGVVIPLTDIGEFGSGGGCCREGGVTWRSGCRGSGDVGWSWDSEGSGWVGGGGEGSRLVVGSSASRLDDSSCAAEGFSVDETGLERGGAGKREYLGFFASITARAGEKSGWRRSKHRGKRRSGARGWEMEKRQWDGGN